MSNAQKTPLSRTLPLFTQRAAMAAIEERGSALPGTVKKVNGAIVTINFDVSGVTLPEVTMAVFGSIYIRLPIQEGDLGVAFPASVYIGGVTGLGGGVADDTVQGNLATLQWFPASNANWPTVADSNSLLLQGPNGVVLRDMEGHTTATLTPAGLVLAAQTSISLMVGSKGISINSTGTTIDGKLFLPHEHVPGTFTSPSGPVTGDSGGVI